VARIEAFGALVYPISPYFEFIFRLDQIFMGGLSEKSLMLNGSHVVRTIESQLLKNECLLELFKGFPTITLKYRSLTNCFISFFIFFHA